ncbi:MAG: hypothetical protein L6Q92_16380 [Phycisphaerae bacterium]|nr:hypothetical protein [Phycisphaerae bacterium]
MRSRRAAGLLSAMLAAGWVAGCVDIKAPERIEIGSGSRGEDVDSSRVPEPRDMEEARSELRRAYRQIQYLERRVSGLEKDKRELKEERDDYKRKYERMRGDD